MTGEDIVGFIEKVGACRRNVRQCNAEENDKMKIVFQKKKSKAQDEMVRETCRTRR
jgi:hypothetical protein